MEYLINLKVNDTHTKMIHWMIQVLIRLAPDSFELSEEAKKTIYTASTTVEALTHGATNLMIFLENFTTFIFA